MYPCSCVLNEKINYDKIYLFVIPCFSRVFCKQIRILCMRGREMSFSSGTFLIFFPVVTIIYFLIPQRIKYIWLLIASYYFYMGWNVEYAFLIFTSTVITYVSGLVLERIKKKRITPIQKSRRMKICVAVSVISNLGILGYFKYTQFFYDLGRKIFALFNVQIMEHNFDILLPVGISFYTFQALSYTIDVYRDDIYAEKNFLKYALFVSFFPQLVAGPIERSKNLLVQINETHKFRFENLKVGFVIMLWGYFLKIVLADKIAIFVDTVYGDYEAYPGWYLVVATALFAVQIYCDFNGYTMIARGAAKIMGFSLMENFDAPYLSTSVSDFWRRWHISLTSWLRDYLYIPLGGSRKGTFRKYINKMIVFLISGLWHGASLSFVIWGALNGIYQVIEETFGFVMHRIAEGLQLKGNSLSGKAVKCFFTFVFVDFAWIFFRANSLKEAIAIIKQIVTVHNPWVLTNGSLYECGLQEKNFLFMLICIGILFVVDLCKRKKMNLIELYEKQDWLFQCVFVAVFVTFILIFGHYGPAYDATNFIYFQF